MAVTGKRKRANDDEQRNTKRTSPRLANTTQAARSAECAGKPKQVAPHTNPNKASSTAQEVRASQKKSTLADIMQKVHQLCVDKASPSSSFVGKGYVSGYRSDISKRRLIRQQKSKPLRDLAFAAAMKRAGS